MGSIFLMGKMAYQLRRKLLRTRSSDRDGYDVVILSDLLHFSASHDMLVASVQMLLAKTQTARVYIGVSSHPHIVPFNPF
jgi:nicotinamide N-methyltransferase